MDHGRLCPTPTRTKLPSDLSKNGEPHFLIVSVAFSVYMLAGAVRSLSIDTVKWYKGWSFGGGRYVATSSCC